jgi:hypothetical protein
MKMNVEAKVEENRLRRMAKRQGLTLRKSRRRDFRALEYGTFDLVDMNGRLVLGNKRTGYGCSLAAIEDFLTRGEK